MTDREASLDRWLEQQLGAMEEALSSLVAINSFTDNVEGGRKVGDLLAREVFTAPGLESSRVSSTRYADHLVFRSAGKSGADPIALIGHLDTVFPPGTFEGYRTDGDLRRGPGVLDMKGGLVVVAFALRALAQVVGLDAIAPLRIVIVADEEVGSPEGQKIIQTAISGARDALVFEAGRKADLIVTRRKGTGAVTAIAEGKAAHAGNAHHAGANAIWALARFIDAAQKLTDYSRGITVNVGIVSGGQSKNTVPDRAEAKIDFRFEHAADGEAVFTARVLAAPTDEALSYLESLPGVAHKTAACVLVFSARTSTTLPVDTHLFRVADRLGLARHDGRNTAATRDRLIAALLAHGPDLALAHFVFLLVGRTTCIAGTPICGSCFLRPHCPHPHRPPRETQ